MKLAERLRRLELSRTLAVQEAAAQLKARGADIIDLSAGEPDFDTPEPIRAAGCQAIEQGYTHYGPSSGLKELRQAVARRYAERCGGLWGAEHVVVTSGAKQALYNVFAALVDHGDEVVIPTPCWVSFPEQVRLVGGVPVFVSTRADTGFALDVGAVEAALTQRTRAIVINSPSNPTGAVLSRESMAAIARLAVERDLMLVSDETYDRFVYGPEGHASAAEHHAALGERLVVVNSFSKTWAMSGWRVGYMLASPVLSRAVAAFQSHTTSHPASMAQRAALAALEGSDASVKSMLEEYRARRAMVCEALVGLEAIELRPPEGAFYAFLEVSELMKLKSAASSSELAEKLVRETGVALVPGSAFEAEGFVRLSYAVGRDRLQAALERITRWAQKP